MKLRLAILDLYDGTANQGMRCIQEIINRFSDQMDWEVFDVRAKNEVPSLDFDTYISSGGPGSPLDGNGVWDTKWFSLVQSIWDWNSAGNYPKKYMFFICHSFQMACYHFNLGSIVPRRSMSFGTFPIHQTNTGVLDPIFKGLANPFWAADFRNWQFIEPDAAQLKAVGAEILALEKIRPHVPLERAVMSVRFSAEMVGVQFHPEADSEGMILHFKDEERKRFIIEKYGEQKYKLMIRDLVDPSKIKRTNATILPNFLSSAIAALKEQNTLAYI